MVREHEVGLKSRLLGMGPLMLKRLVNSTDPTIEDRFRLSAGVVSVRVYVRMTVSDPCGWV